MLAAIVMIGGCADGSPAGVEDAAGTYVLAAAGGKPLPAVVFDGHVDDEDGGFQFRAEAVAGTLALTADGRYTHTASHSRRYDGVGDQPLNRQDHGTWTRTGNTLVLTSTYLQGMAYTATLSGRTLSFSHDYLGEGIAATYRYTR